MMVTLSGALPIAPAKQTVGGMGKQPSVTMERRTAPTQASPSAQGRWAASTALKTVSPTTATGGSPCVAPNGEHAWKVALGVGQSLLAKVTLDPCPQVRYCSPNLKFPQRHTVCSLSPSPAISTSKPPCRTSSLLSPSHPGNPPSPLSGHCVPDPPRHLT